MLLLRWGYTMSLWNWASNGPFVYPLEMIYEWRLSSGGMILTGENRNTSRKTCPRATSYTINPTRTDLGANPGPRGEKSITNRLTYGTACWWSQDQIVLHSEFCFISCNCMWTTYKLLLLLLLLLHYYFRFGNNLLRFYWFWLHLICSI
jgi:hypothetical protein